MDINSLKGFTPGKWQWEFCGTAGQWTLYSDLDNQPKFVQLGGPPDVPLSPDQRLTQASPYLLELAKMGLELADTLFSYANREWPKSVLDKARTLKQKAGEL